MDDWKPQLDDLPDEFEDCIRSGHPDPEIPPYEDEDYFIMDGIVCLNPTGPNYDALKRFYKSHKTRSNRRVDERYDDYVYSDFDESVLPKNIKVLAYALTEGEFSTIFYEALMQGEIEGFYDVDQAFFDFMYAAAHFPAFCGEKSETDPRDLIEVCRQELVMFLTDVVANSRFDETTLQFAGVTEVADKDCKEALAAGADPTCEFRFSMLAEDEQFLSSSDQYFFRRGFGAGV